MVVVVVVVVVEMNIIKVALSHFCCRTGPPYSQIQYDRGTGAFVYIEYVVYSVCGTVFTFVACCYTSY